MHSFTDLFIASGIFWCWFIGFWIWLAGMLELHDRPKARAYYN